MDRKETWGMIQAALTKSFQEWNTALDLRYTTLHTSFGNPEMKRGVIAMMDVSCKQLEESYRRAKVAAITFRAREYQEWKCQKRIRF